MRAILILVLVACLAAVTPSLAQSPQGGQGGSNAAQHQQKLGETLDKLQKNPKIKSSVSTKMREKLTQKSPPDLEQRMAAINALLDQVSKMNDATWKVKRDQMVQAVWQQIHVPKQGGGQNQGGGKHKNKGGGQ